MNARPLSTLGRLRTALLTVMLATLATLVAVGCVNDPAKEFTLVLSTDRGALTGDGSDFAIIRVTVLDQNGNPPSIGSEVALQAQGPASVGGSGDSFGTSFTDATGTAQFNIACTDVGELTVIGIYEDANGFLTTVIECREPPAGDWEILMAIESSRLELGEITQVTVDATDGQGAPVPSGTGLTLEVTSGDVVWYPQRAKIISVATDGPSGRWLQNAEAPENNGTAQLCARFTDERYGPETCRGVVVTDEVVTGARCDCIFGRERAPADGETVTQLTCLVVNDDGEPVGEALVSFETQSGEYLDEPTDETGNFETEFETGIDGDVTTYLLSPIEPNSASASAIAEFDYVGEDGEESVVLECNFDVDLVFYPEPACEFEPMVPEVLGVAGSSVDERGELKVCFVDISGATVAPGQRVEFELLVRTDGVALATTSALTDAEGCAVTQLEAGSQAGIVEIRATLAFGLNESTCTSGPLAIAGARPTEDGLVLQCSHDNITAMIREGRGDEVLADCQVQCFAILRDRYNNPVTHPNTRVFFRSEQGTILSPVSPDSEGRIAVNYNPNGGIPFDVDPMPGEPSDVSVGVDGRLRNSRDMLVTIMAWTAGEEAFVDGNGNGSYDDGEVFTDLPEPFLDVNDDNTFNPTNGDQFVDIETPVQPFDGEWSEGNREWDASTTIWTSTHVMISGDPGSVVDDSTFQGAPIVPITRTGVIEYRPIDRYHNNTSAAAAFNFSHNCDQVRLGEQTTFALDGLRFDLYRDSIPHASDGRVVPPGSSVAYTTHATVFDFTVDPGVPSTVQEVVFPEEMDGRDQCSVRLEAVQDVMDTCTYRTWFGTGIYTVR